MNVLPKKEELTQKVSIAAEKIGIVAAKAGETVVATVKKYPLHTAIVTGAIGLIAGAFARKQK